MLIIKKIKLINKKKFIIVIINLENKTFVLYMIALNIKIFYLLYNKKFIIIIIIKYSNFINLFLSKFIIKLLEYNNRNYIIKLQ